MNVELTAGNDNLLSVGAAVGGKLSDRSSGRLSLHHFESNAFRDNDYFGRDDTNGREELTARGKLQWSFANDWNALLTGLYMDFNNGYDAWTVRNDEITHTNKPGRDSQETRAASLRLSGPLNDRFDLVSISSLADSDVFFSYDGDWGSDDFWRQYGDYIYDYGIHQPPRAQQPEPGIQVAFLTPGACVQRLDRLGNWRLLAGGLKEDNQVSSTGVYDDSGEENFCPPCLTDRQITSAYKADTLAFFGSLDARLKPKIGALDRVALRALGGQLR